MQRLFNGVSGIAHGAVHMRDRMAGGAGDTGMCRWVIHIIEFRIVESTREKRHRVVATGTPTRGADIAIACQRHLAGFAHTEQIRRIVERTEVVRRVEPTLVHILMAAKAVFVRHQRLRGNEITGSRSGFRRIKIALSLTGAFSIPLSQILKMQTSHNGSKRHRCQTQYRAPAPADGGACSPVHHVNAHSGQRR